MAVRMTVNPPQTQREDEVVTFTCGACEDESVKDPNTHVRLFHKGQHIIRDNRFLNYYNTKEGR